MWSPAGTTPDQQICGFEPGLRTASLSAALGLSRVRAAGRTSHFGTELHGAGPPAALGPSRTWPVFLLLWPGRCAALALCVGQLASVPGAHPPTRGFRCGRHARVSGVGGQLGFQLWAPSLVIWVCATGLQVSAGAAYPAFTVQGLRGEGHQRPRLLQRFL